MTALRDPDTIIAAWLDEGPSVLPEATRRSIAVSNRTIHQARRPMWWPWRDSDVNSIFKLALAGAAVIAVTVGGLYVINRGPSGPGSVVGPTASPSLTPAPSANTPGITGFTPYTSDVYGFTLGIPNDWTLYEAATREWQPSDASETAGAFTDVINSSLADAGIWVWRRPAGSGADITSHNGLAAWVQANQCDDTVNACATVPVVAVPMCAGRTACLPAIVVPLSGNELDFGNVRAVVADPESGMVTVLSLGRPDDWQGVAKYGGGVQLLQSILTTMDVWPPEPGQIPSP